MVGNGSDDLSKGNIMELHFTKARNTFVKMMDLYLLCDCTGLHDK